MKSMGSSKKFILNFGSSFCEKFNDVDKKQFITNSKLIMDYGIENETRIFSYERIKFRIIRIWL